MIMHKNEKLHCSYKSTRVVVVVFVCVVGMLFVC